MAGEVFNAVPATINASQREALAALARGGTQERDAYLAGIQAQAADKASLYRDILDRATAINAPAEGQDMAAHAAPGLDARSQALLGARSSAGNALGIIAAAHRNYFDEVAKALPIVQARAQQALAAKQSGSDLSDSELATRLRGAAQVVAEQDLADAARYQQQVPVTPQTHGGYVSPALASSVDRVDKANARAAEPTYQRARDMGVDAGIDPARIYGLAGLQPPTQTDRTRTPSQQYADMEALAKIARLNLYNTAKRAASPATFAEFQTALDPKLNGGVDPFTYIASLKDSDLRKRGISRAALLDWVTRYSSI